MNVRMVQNQRAKAQEKATKSVTHISSMRVFQDMRVAIADNAHSDILVRMMHNE